MTTLEERIEAAKQQRWFRKPDGCLRDRFRGVISRTIDDEDRATLHEVMAWCDRQARIAGGDE